MEDLFTSQNQACWQERIWKEAAARVSWKINYGHKYLKEGPLPKKRLQRAPFSSAPAVGSLPATSSPDSKDQTARDQGGPGSALQESRYPGPPAQGIQRLGGAKTNSESPGQTKPKDLGMRQVPPSTLRLLLQGISHDSQGRALYLREWHRQKPEEKFQYPVLSSWKYGWHVGTFVPGCRREQDRRSRAQTVDSNGCVRSCPRSTAVLFQSAVHRTACKLLPCRFRAAGDAMKDARPSVYARSQPITQTFYVKSGVFHLPRRTDQLM